MTRRTPVGSTAGHVLGWVAAAGLTAVVINRLWRSESVPILIGLQGVTAWALAPAYVLAAAALWGRRPALAVVAVALSAAQLVVAAGTIGWSGPQPADQDELAIRLVSANVLYTNDDIRRLGDELASEEADIVVLQEVTDRVLDELRESELWALYPYRSLAPHPLFLGAATFSRFPIVGGGPIDVAGNPMLSTDIRTPNGVVRVIDVHTVAPLTTPDAETWSRQHLALADLVARSPHPIVLAGDFNATLDHGPLERLVTGEVRDAFRVAGTGTGATWPVWSWPMPQLMRLDHVLVTPGVDVLSITERAGTGSDHLRLVADLGIRGGS